jgi:arylsulfatase A-like enzyme
LVEFVDIYPTLCELAGLIPPDGLEGWSFGPLMQRPARPWKAAAFSQYPRSANRQRLMGYSMRTARYRYTQWRLRDDPTRVVARELYDHQSDPQENVNLAARPDADRQVLAKLAAQLERGWRGALPPE